MIYAIDRETKRHRIATTRGGSLAILQCCHGQGETLVEADADGWIPWDEGSGNPLPEDARCDVLMLGKKVVPHVVAHKNAEWGCVTHYRPIFDADTEPEPPAWDGEGLPPVGARVEVEDGCKGTVLAAAHLKRQGARAWLELDDGDQRVPSVECIRPIRSEEDKAVEELTETIADIAAEQRPCLARALYRAGYRKEG